MWAHQEGAASPTLMFRSHKTAPPWALWGEEHLKEKMPSVLKHRSFPSHHEHASVRVRTHTPPQTHINIHAHTQTPMHTEKHILNHSQTQNRVLAQRIYIHRHPHNHMHRENPGQTHTHTHRHVHTVLCVFNLLASAASGHGLPQTLYPAQCMLQLGLHVANAEQQRTSVRHCGWAALFWARPLAPCSPGSVTLWVSGS